jgi:hypothetical protein
MDRTIRKGPLELEPAKLAAVVFAPKAVPHRLKPHSSAGRESLVLVQSSERRLVMNLRWTLAVVLIIAVAPAVGGEARQMWKCELDDDATEEQVMQGAQEWLAAAKTMNGGQNLEAYVNFPVAVNATGEMDLVFMLVAPSLTEWGEFWDGYGGSPAAKVDEANDEFVICPDSALWESFKVKTTAETPPKKKTAVAAMQMWKCELDLGATEEQVMQGAQEWLAAARTMKGGKNFEAYVNFPIAVNFEDESDLVFVLVAPSFKEWGEFWDGYGGSPAAKVDEANNEFVICPDSALWESVKVELPK